MLRIVADLLLNQLREAFPDDRAYTWSDLGRAPMPPQVAHFIAQTLRRRYEVEVENLEEGRTPWFDYNHPDVAAAQKAFLVVLKQHGRIPQTEWAKVLRQGVNQVLAYLVKPAEALADFVYQESADRLPATAIRRRMGYFVAYPYLREGVDAYLERHQRPDLERERFAELVAEIDRQHTKGFTPPQWLALLVPLSALVSVAPVSGGAGIPVRLLRAFFEAKGAAAVQERLQHAEEEYGAEVLSEADLRRLLLETRKPVPAPAPPVLEVDELPELPEPQAPRPSRPAVPPASDEPVPLWKRFQNGDGNGAASAPAAVVEAAPVRNEPASDVPLWQRFRQGGQGDAGITSVAQPPPAAVPSALEALERAVLGPVGRQERERFVRALFAGSGPGYEATLRRLKGAESWKQAAEIIAREVFKRNGVDIYSSEAIAFTNAVERRFRSR